MSREQSAREAVQALIRDDTILDVALTYPRGSTKAQALGGAAGGLMAGGDFVGVGVIAGSAVGGKIFNNLKELPPTIVLAVSETAVYTLGRHKMGLVGGWDKLTKMVKFDRSTLRTDVHQRAVTLEITLTDTEHDVLVELEAKRLGNLGIKAITELLVSDQNGTDDPTIVDEQRPT
jgi:hypothetical protein